MEDWTDGYVTDISYTFGYYRELNPLRLCAAFLNHGLVFPRVETACELGFGQGISVNIHAAASPAEWYGTDFNPAQAALAREMAEAAGSGAKLFDEAFEDFARRDDLPDFDFIGLHGIWSWISDENQQVIVDFLKRRLKVGGALYISYNTLPGWTDFVPMRHLMTEHVEVLEARGRGLVNRIGQAVDFAERFMAVNPQFCRANPGLKTRMERLRRHDAHYLAHEYFNRDWLPMHFAEVAKRLTEAKLQYACSAHYMDHITPFNLTQEQEQFLQEIPDPMFRESIYDFMVNQQFRRDYWVKGARRMNRADQAAALRAQRCILVVPKDDVSLKAPAAQGTVELRPEIYEPILDCVQDNRPHSLGELEEALKGQEATKSITFSQLYQAAMTLMSMGHLEPVQDEADIKAAKKSASRLNAYLRGRARGSRDVENLASPVTGGGVRVNRFQQMFLESMAQGKNDPGAWAKYVWENLSALDERLLKDDKPLETVEDNLKELERQAGEFKEKRLPILKALGVA